MNKNRVPNQSPSGADRRLAEARQLFGAGNVHEAEALLFGVIAENPLNLQALIALGIIAAETGQTDLAIDRMSKVIVVYPKCVPALCWLSSLMLKQGKFEEAKLYAQRSTTFEPSNPATHSGMARALVGAGQFTEAVPYFKRASDLSPGNPVPLYELTNTLLELRNERDAIHALRQAVQIAPESFALLKLAYLEFGLGRIEDAEKYCLRALKLDPALAQGHVLMGRIATETLQPELAEVHWRKAEEVAPHPGFTNLDKALSLAAIGQFGNAIAELERSIEAKPIQGAAYQALVFSKRIGNDDLPFVHRMEGLVESSTLSDTDRLNVLYSLGKSYDNLGDYERAISYFDHANALKRRLMGSPVFDRMAFKAGIDAKIKLFTKQYFAGWKHIGLDSNLPIMIVGMMRSGTTLAEQMLSCHPQVGGSGEQQYWGEHDGMMIDYSRLVADEAMIQRTSKSYLNLLKSLAPGLPRVIDKNPANLLVLGSLHLAFPNVSIVHTRRNPVDTALSIWMTPMSTNAPFVGDRENIVYAYKEYLRLMDHWREVLPTDKFLEIQYEDLVSQPEIYARQMVEFCGLEWNEACLHPENNERRIRTPSFWQVRQPIYKSSTERWKKYERWLGPFGELEAI